MVKKSATFIAGPRKKNGQLMLKRPKLIKSFQESIFKGGVKQGALRKWSALAQFSDWLILRSQCGCLANLNHQLSDSSWSGVYMLVVSMLLTSFTLWGFQYLHNSSRIWLRILYRALEKELKVFDFLMDPYSLTVFPWTFLNQFWIHSLAHFSHIYYNILEIAWHCKR